MVMTAEAEEVPKTAERTPLISNDHRESSRNPPFLLTCAKKLSSSPIRDSLLKTVEFSTWPLDYMRSDI